MIINCNKCNKKFNVDDRLIPPKGRVIQCGNCSHIWFFKNNNDVNLDTIKLDNQESEQIAKKTNQKSKYPIKNKKNIEKDYLKNILKSLLIILITFFAVVICIDTFKIHISSFLPGILPFLDNLYSTLNDIRLFVKDLFN